MPTLFAGLVTDQYFSATLRLIVILIVLMENNDLRDHQLIVLCADYDKDLLARLESREVYSLAAVFIPISIRQILSVITEGN